MAAALSSTSSPPSQRTPRRRRDRPPPFAIRATTSRLPSSATSTSSGGGGGGSGGGGASGPIRLLCPYTGSDLSSTSSVPLKVPMGLGVSTAESIPSTLLVGSSSSFGKRGGGVVIGAEEGDGPVLAYAVDAATARGRTTSAGTALLLSSSSEGGSDGGGGGGWRCKTPESLTSAGLALVPPGRYAVGAGISGKCYLWDLLGNGSGSDLVRTWHAHHRPVSALCCQLDGWVVTGGDDGVVSAWCLLDLLDRARSGSSSAERSSSSAAGGLQPHRTWAEHHLPVSCLHPLPSCSDRFLSGSTDRTVIVMELFSGSVLARILLPGGVASLTTDALGRRLYAGGTDGIVYGIDLDATAIAATAAGAAIAGNAGGDGAGKRLRRRRGDVTDEVTLGSFNETVLGMTGPPSGGGDNGGGTTRPSELRGHDKAVTALAVVPSSDEGDWDDGGGLDGLLVSGSEDGTIRVWDVSSGGSGVCLRVLRPWGVGAVVSSIRVVSRIDRRSGGRMFSGAVSSAARLGFGGGNVGLTSLVKPLQRFEQRSDVALSSSTGTAAEKTLSATIPIVRAKRNLSSFPGLLREEQEFGGSTYSLRRRYRGRLRRAGAPQSTKRPRVEGETEMAMQEDVLAVDTHAGGATEDEKEEGEKKESGSSGSPVSAASTPEDDAGTTVSPSLSPELLASAQAEADRLRAELKEARSTISRWEKVNNKLAAKLNKAQAAASTAL